MRLSQIASTAIMMITWVSLSGSTSQPAAGEVNASDASHLTSYSKDELIETDAELQLLGEGYAFTEGPSSDRSGNVFFTDQPNDRIMRWDAESGEIDEWLKPAGRSNGTWIDGEGNLLACADEQNELWMITPEKEVTVLLRDFNAKRFNGPNDLWVDNQLGIYFTDPLYVRPYWERSGESELEGENVYRLPAGESEPVVAAGGFKRPNGIIGTPDRSKLYVADIGDNKTYVFDIAEDGQLSNRRLFCEQGSDGMTIDASGNVYLTGRGVSIYSPAGEKLLQIEVPQRWTANVTFGGKDGQLLFITASQAVYGIRMNVKGAFAE